MKNTITYILIFLACQFLVAQTYTGSVKDAQGNEVAFANVIVKSTTDGKLITGVITDEAGKFEITVTTSEAFQLIVSFVGYKNWEKIITPNSPTAIGIITLLESENQLKEVVITAKKPIIQRKAGKLIFNIKNSVASNGFNAMEALKFAPKIDPTSDGIKMIGKSKLAVMVNDRLLNLDGQSLDSYLKSLRSENIEKIEIITNPPARFDASGNSGLINIILKKNTNIGFDGSVTATYVQRSYPGFMPSTYLKYSTDRMLIAFNLFADNEAKRSESSNEFLYPTLRRNGSTRTKQEIDGLSSGLNFEYKFSDNHKAGIILNSDIWKTEGALQNNTIFRSLSSQQIDSALIAPSNNTNKYDYLSASAYYDIKLDTIGSTLQFNYNHLKKNNEDDRSLFLSRYEGDLNNLTGTNSALNISEADYQVNSLNVDVELPIKDSKLGFGGKLTFLKNDSDIQFFDTTSGTSILDANQSNVFAYDEEVYALYTSYQRPLGEAFYLILGLRYEHTQTRGNSITTGIVTENNFNNIFPSLTLAYDPSDKHSFSVGYSKRIDRPGFSDINPFRSYTDFFSFNEGNPLLIPSITHNIDFSYIFNNDLEISVYHTILKDAVDFITLTTADTNTVISRPENFYDQSTFGLDIYYNFNPTSWFNSNNGFSAYYNSSESKIPTVTLADLSGSGFYISTRNTFTLNKEKGNTVYVNFFQNFPETNGFLKTFNRANLQIGGKFTFMDKRLTLNASVSDIFRQNRNRNREIYQNYTFNSRIYNDIRRLNVALTYTFGNNKSKSSRRKADDSDKSRL
ncbi:TonB-dependent receptor [Kordia algicida OT-1]|uniref:Possible TonB-dependent receptor n=1 Tax=Kordia algicida OT-1 TaxID=391587 RepID=A9DYJ0_9FLAO|nr:TonB-dependent receptor [Kordia algicida]EDP96139.1 possible TonB-dependent receptor [Kordia algicida OT-1]